MLRAMSAVRLALTPSRAGASGSALTAAQLAGDGLALRASCGKDSRAGSAGRPRVRSVLVSDGRQQDEHGTA